MELDDRSCVLLQEGVDEEWASLAVCDSSCDMQMNPHPFGSPVLFFFFLFSDFPYGLAGISRCLASLKASLSFSLYIKRERESFYIAFLLLLQLLVCVSVCVCCLLRDWIDPVT